MGRFVALSLVLSLVACTPDVEDSGTVRSSKPDPLDDTAPADTDTDTDADTDTDTDADSDTDTDSDTDADTDADTDPVDADGDGYSSEYDCDDNDNGVNPDAGEGHFGSDRGRDDDCDGEVDEVPTVEFTTDDYRVWMYLANTQPGSWWFGMAETGVGTDGWYGEDCIDDPADHADYGYEVCHPFEATDLTLLRVSSLDDIVAGEATLFYDALLPDVTFYLATEDEALCWVWGDDPDWYLVDSHGGVGPFGCTEL
ncbi:MAG: hypothetical protein V4850_22490 [Myxococcota bacterium]